MKDTTKYILLGAGTAAGVAAAASAAASAALMGIALDRTNRGAALCRRQLSGSEAWQAFAQPMSEAAARLRRSGCSRITITARDGIALTGFFYEHPQPRRVIVAMHGWRSSWDQDFGLIAPFFMESGCSILFAQQRGQGESGGDMMTFGLMERFDCADWVAWVRQETQLPIYLAGISMGATTVLLASALCRVEGIIADCGFTSPTEIWRHVAQCNLHLRYELCSPWVKLLCKRRFLQELEGLSTVDALRQSRTPVLLIHGTADTFVPVEMTYENYLACRGPRQLLIVPGAGHGMSYLTEPEKYKQAVLQFWQTYG